MELILSDTMGYCGGVSRAIDLVEQAIKTARESGKPVYSVGNVIHNTQVCDSFSREGLIAIESPEGHDPGYVVLRAHGVPDRLHRVFLEAGFTVIDATCPVVKRNLSLLAEYCAEYSIIVIGKEGHPETIALQGVERDGKVCPTILISESSQVLQLPKGKKFAVFVQTTFERTVWDEIRVALHMMEKEGRSFVFANNVCPSSRNRRNAALRLCSQCDAIIVIGGKNSANTTALYQLIKQQGKKVWHIETEQEVTEEMRSYSPLGLTAGASTPPSTIETVRMKLMEEK
ncbi:(E)-4-hydroxy-3-methyl-but-2-enyl pyrophosphate reductase [Sphaerochaeta pleomorpha str. Grapes]|uniref:4-hydroxy-3-methylbut-2-enyl diphosphate reductase n=1 Tax=Sphaerochaeta pleomorpha (strain ATCC BAA-1885 / DSM 22778 / Grapes) TaxID=158190 RepID=G8QR25_SPHPG|nr:4-hydroxy-3-methylbut-2-enyl diphosphate reductase [Sphaerochaeta pleomorpha]AEV29873.1 (E)-4-hydroxy-3-methyl-but-2-enyl pyrophosphate reductase [Sphaerochaeta pleomorpha str. Grapes]